ncbi:MULTISPECIES: ABC transporter permease [Aerococcus]|uniref:ABC transporter permease n=1 Tax=Aerococcus tenax TaxID=3078812 RepID=A0A5N1BHA4_9LACT|nr:ABC transporter permease [Aerococcus urinae]KAA9239478.1 ABC transporter permease [Aerococcus urinae]MDK6370505.1 ABC transporter permease [Aerococcus urinae]MDK6596823.1 ABC transporter permease [Aerococcus urinae]MDK7302287.1 ABC transporter permease [Aerococcus urinae]MDK7800761.1 ABC transporter permease [Aerococcus urinae]
MKFVILNNNLKRLFKAQSYLWLSILIAFVTVAASAFVLTMDAPKPIIGVASSASDLLAMNNDDLSIEELTEGQQNYTQLITGQYDAYISKEAGKYQVTTVRNSALGETLSQLFNEGRVPSQPGPSDDHFKVLLSVLAMSSMILSLILYRFYFDDRQGIDKRIYVSGLSTFSYLFQQALFTFLLLFTISTLACCSLFPLFDLDLSGRFFLDLFLVELFAANFGMVLSTMTNKNQGVLLVGTMLSVLSTLLSGALLAVKEDSLQEKIQPLFPQFYIAKLGSALDGQVESFSQSLGVLLLYSLAFFVIALLIQKRRIVD